MNTQYYKEGNSDLHVVFKGQQLLAQSVPCQGTVKDGRRMCAGSEEIERNGRKEEKVGQGVCVCWESKGKGGGARLQEELENGQLEKGPESSRPRAEHNRRNWRREILVG